MFNPNFAVFFIVFRESEIQAILKQMRKKLQYQNDINLQLYSAMIHQKGTNRVTVILFGVAFIILISLVICIAALSCHYFRRSRRKKVKFHSDGVPMC